MKKVLNLVKTRKSSSAGGGRKGQGNKSPSGGSLGQGSSSLGCESASTSMIYEAQPERSSSQIQNDAVSPSKMSSGRASVSQSPITQVHQSYILLNFLTILGFYLMTLKLWYLV